MNGSKPLMARHTSVGVSPAGRSTRRLPSPLPTPAGEGDQFPRWNDPGRIGCATRWIANLPLPAGERQYAATSRNTKRKISVWINWR